MPNQAQSEQNRGQIEPKSIPDRYRSPSEHLGAIRDASGIPRESSGKAPELSDPLPRRPQGTPTPSKSTRETPQDDFLELRFRRAFRATPPERSSIDFRVVRGRSDMESVCILSYGLHVGRFSCGAAVEGRIEPKSSPIRAKIESKLRWIGRLSREVA